MGERIVSADSHVNPPKDLWVRNVPQKFKDRAPRVESTDMGDFWIVDAQISGAIGLDSSAGRKPEEFKPHGLSYKDMRPGAYDPKAGAVASLFDVVRDARLNHRVDVRGGIREAECAALLRDFFATR